jgi:hypothetical protein
MQFWPHKSVDPEIDAIALELLDIEAAIETLDLLKQSNVDPENMFEAIEALGLVEDYPNILIVNDNSLRQLNGRDAILGIATMSFLAAIWTIMPLVVIFLLSGIWINPFAEWIFGRG